MYFRRRNSHRRNKSQMFQKQKNKRNIETLQEHVFIKKAVQTPIHQETTMNKTFRDFQLAEIIKRNIDARGYRVPSPIQEQTIPYILEGRDVIGIANTGTGKTAAFLLPLLHRMLSSHEEKTLIITPTRELAIQIQDELFAFSRGVNIESVLCIGGASIHNQERLLRRNPRVVIGTPGRLKDLIRRRTLDLKTYKNFILDEVDRMLDIGFIHDIRFIISYLPEERQSLFFSATMNDSIKEIIRQFLKNPVTISVKKHDTSTNIDQDVIRVKNKEEKIEILQRLLKTEGFDKVLVFGRTKWGIEKLHKLLQKNGFLTAAIHGNKSQGQRQRALQMFKQEQLQALLATDVASRGLDIENVTHVINFDPPATYDDYIHRIGRTGRANKKGIALTFIE